MIHQAQQELLYQALHRVRCAWRCSAASDICQSQGKGSNLKGAILDQMMPKSMDFNGFQ